MEEANVALIKAKKRPFSEKDWSEFNQLISKAQTKKVSPNPYTNYPITSITQPLFSATFAYTGATVGLLSGDVLSKSTKGMRVKYQLTALIGGSLLLFGPTGPTGVALFAPVIASKLITSFCSITLAHVLGATMGLLGYGVGTVVGLPLDLAYHLLWKVCAAVGGYYYPESEKPTITGIRISDGVALIGGIAINMTPVDKLAEIAHKKQIIELKEDGSLHVDGKPIITEKNGVQLPPIVIEELKEHFKTYSTGAIEGPKIEQEDPSTVTESAGQEVRLETREPTCSM